MLNKIKVKNFEVWDAETGEADITAIFDNNSELKAFTLDHFENNEEIDIELSLFCNDFEILDKQIEEKITNIEDNFRANVSGKIIEFKSDEEEGNILLVDAGNIFVHVYIPFEEINIPEGISYFKGSGRLDIETQIES
jgi:ribosomal silencing factor RsfS